MLLIAFHALAVSEGAVSVTRWVSQENICRSCMPRTVVPFVSAAYWGYHLVVQHASQVRKSELGKSSTLASS